MIEEQFWLLEIYYYLFIMWVINRNTKLQEVLHIWIKWV